MPLRGCSVGIADMGLGGDSAYLGAAGGLEDIVAPRIK